MKRIVKLLVLVALGGIFTTSCEGLEDVIGSVTGDGDKKVDLSVTPATLTIPADGGSATFALTAPQAWSATSDAEWLSIDPAAGVSGEQVITVSADKNEGDTREAKVTVEAGKVSASLVVTQKGANGTEPGPGTEPDDTKWYICGAFTDNWKAESAIEMTPQGNGIHTLQINLPDRAEFKFIQDKSWDVNLGAVERGNEGDNTSPSIIAGETVELTENGYNLYFVPGGDVTITLDVNNKTALIEGGNPQPSEPDVWSVIGTIGGTNWDKDFNMTLEQGIWKTTIYYALGDEFKLRLNHDWVKDYGYGPIIRYFDSPMNYGLVEQGPNITLPSAGYWDLSFNITAGTLTITPSENVQWQYFTNPDGSVANVTFNSTQNGSAIQGKIKYYEVNGVRTCVTETENGIFGMQDSEWHFVWYTDSNLIYLPIQPSGFMYESYGEATVFTPYTYYAVMYVDENTQYAGISFPEFAQQQPEGYYDGNGGFYFSVLWYLWESIEQGYKMESYDVVAEADGFERFDYSLSIGIGPSIQGNRDITFTAGKDVAEVRYVFLDGQIQDDDKAFAIAQQLIDKSIEYNYLNDFIPVDAKHGTATITYTAQVPGYHTVVAVSFDADGNDYYWYYYWFYLDPAETGLTWTSIGKGTYTDDVIASTFSNLENLSWEVEIEQCNEDPTRIRMIYPYDGKYAMNDEGDWATDKSYDIEIRIPDDTHVYIRPQQMGVDWGYGMMSMASLAGYHIEYGTAIEDIDAAMFGKYVDGVITFPEKSLLISMADRNGGGWYYANYNSAFKLVLPGWDATATNPAPKKPAAVSRKSVKHTGKVIKTPDAGKGGRTVRLCPKMEPASL